MKKKTLYLSMILAFIMLITNMKVVSALDYESWIGGKIIVRWIDYGDPRNERPESIDLVVGERLSTLQHHTITLNETDATISESPDNSTFNSHVTEWKFDKGYYDKFFIHHGDSPDCLYEYSYIENLQTLGYNEVSSHITGDLHPTKFSLSGGILEEPGTLVITLIKDTLTTKNLTVTYNDSDARDSSFIRSLDFAIKGQNVADPVAQNAYYRFRIHPSDTIKGNNSSNTYTKSIIISGTDSYQAGNPIIDYIFEEDNQNIIGRTITYKIEGDNIFVTVNYQAKTNIVPIEVVWQDDDDKLGLRPTNLKLKAYDQKGNFEKEITLSEDDNWQINETLYKNMRYSGGTPIDYVMKLEANDDYKYTVSKDGSGYKVLAKLKNQEDVLMSDDGTINKVKPLLKEKNPQTGDGITGYVLIFVLGLVSLIAVSKLKAIKN